MHQDSNQEGLQPRNEANVEIARKYAHFQRLMCELMWDCLIGQDAPVPGVTPLWLYHSDDGEPLRHELQLPTGDHQDEPTYNQYQKVIYLVSNPALLSDIKDRLAELAVVQQQAVKLAGLKQTSEHLLYPDLVDDVVALRFSRKIRFSSNRLSKERITALLRRVLEEKRTMTQQKYETRSFGEDPVLAARYAEITRLETGLHEIAMLEETSFRVRRPYRSVFAYLYDTSGQTHERYVLNVGLIVVGKEVEVTDMNQTKRFRKPDRRSFRPEPLVEVDGMEIFSEEMWQAFREHLRHHES
jgi:hypothetical protein